MNLFRLSLMTITLSLCVGLAYFNPTMDQYLAFVEAQLEYAIERSDQSQPRRERDMVKAIFLSHSHELVDGVVRRHTIRRNWGLASLYESNVLDARILVLGIGGHFIPLKGLDDSILRLGRIAFSR